MGGDQMKFGNILNIALNKENITILELANKLHVTDRTVYRWLDNKNEPDFDTLCKICNILNIDFGDIVKIQDIDKNQIINIAQDSNENFILDEYRKLDKKQRKLYMKNFITIMNIFKLENDKK